MTGLSSVVVALGSNLGDRQWSLRRAVDALHGVMRVVAVSPVHETRPVDAPAGSPDFLNMVVAGFTTLTPETLLDELLAIERQLGRVRRERNAPRTIDLDLIVHSGNVRRSARLTLPHPRYREREFVTRPLRELGLPWVDPRTGEPLS